MHMCTHRKYSKACKAGEVQNKSLPATRKRDCVASKAT